MTIEDIRYKLQMGDKYLKYTDFKKRIIITAHKELAEKTDIAFDFTEIKDGKSVVALEFAIKRNETAKEERKAKIENEKAAKQSAKTEKRKDALTPEEIKYYQNEFIKEKAGNKVIMGRFKKDGFESVMVQNTFDDWLTKKIK